MIERGYGKIINLSSTWSTSTDLGKSVYGAAKAGVSYLTAALSTEWAPMGMRVNAIAPTSTLDRKHQPKAFRDNPERAQRLLSRITSRAIRATLRHGRRRDLPGQPGLRLRHRAHVVR